VIGHVFTRHMGGFGVFYGLIKAWHWSMLFSRSLAVYLFRSIILSSRPSISGFNQDSTFLSSCRSLLLDHLPAFVTPQTAQASSHLASGDLHTYHALT
jgi:hypothetical protein